MLIILKLREDYLLKLILNEIKKKINDYKKPEGFMKFGNRVNEVGRPLETSEINNLMDKIIFEENSIYKQNKFDFILLLMDLLLYNNQELVNYSFILIFKGFSKRETLITNLNQIQLIEDEEKIKDYHNMEKLNENLQFLSDSTEKWMFMQDQRKNTLECISILDQLDNHLTLGKIYPEKIKIEISVIFIYFLI